MGDDRLDFYYEPDTMFYAWECVSLVMGSSRTSVDFVVKDNTDLMCLLHVIRHGLNNQVSSSIENCQTINTTSCLSMYRVLSFKMKLAY